MGFEKNEDNGVKERPHDEPHPPKRTYKKPPSGGFCSVYSVLSCTVTVTVPFSQSCMVKIGVWLPKK